jgi:hypothetical protein
MGWGMRTPYQLMFGRLNKSNWGTKDEKNETMHYYPALPGGASRTNAIGICHPLANVSSTPSSRNENNINPRSKCPQILESMILHLDV